MTASRIETTMARAKAPPPGPRSCLHCKTVFTPKTAYAVKSKYCQNMDCIKERKLESDRRSRARRKHREGQAVWR